jgi:hypothetical protein
MPKLGLLATASFGRPDIKRDLKGEFPRYCFYGATDISMFMPVPIMSATVYSGIKVGSFTFDNSIAFRRVLSQHKSIPNGPYVFTVNPKIGVKIAKIWFKLGTSYKIGGDLEEFENWMKIGNLYCNFDLNYIQPIKNP